MGMVGGGDQHGVDLSGHLIEHFPEVGETFNRRMSLLLALRMGAVEVHVTKRDDVAKPCLDQRLEVRFTTIPNANGGQVHSFARWQVATWCRCAERL